MRKLIALPRERKAILVEAVFWLFVARLIVLVPLARWSRYLGTLQGQTSSLDKPNHVQQIKRIGWAIRAASLHVPWRADCLPQAVAGRIMLERRKIPSTLYFGLAKTRLDGQVSLSAHAWLRSGTIVVTGRGLIWRFNVVSTFAKDYS